MGKISRTTEFVINGLDEHGDIVVQETGYGTLSEAEVDYGALVPDREVVRYEIEKWISKWRSLENGEETLLHRDYEMVLSKIFDSTAREAACG
jgi:hypothetical protein